MVPPQNNGPKYPMSQNAQGQKKQDWNNDTKKISKSLLTLKAKIDSAIMVLSIFTPHKEIL